MRKALNENPMVQLACVLVKLDASEAVKERIKHTRALDGMQDGD